MSSQSPDSFSHLLAGLPGGDKALLALTLRTDSGSVPLPWNGEAVHGGATWRVITSSGPVEGRTDALEVTASVQLVTGNSPASSIRLEAQFSGWDPASYVFAPSMVYDGNRFEIVDVPYSPFWPDASHYAVDKPISVTDQVHLRKDGSPAVIEIDSWGVATPCLGWRSPAGKGFLLFTPDHNEVGPLGLTIAEDGPAGSASFAVESPRRRAKIPKIMGFREGDPLRDWKAGDTATLSLRLHLFDAPRLQDLFDRYAGERKVFGTRRTVKTLPFSAAEAMVREKVNALNWDEELGYYRHGISRLNTKTYDWWQLGWVSGGLTTLPMIAQGDPVQKARAHRNLAFLFEGSPVDNGLWKAHHDGTQFNNDDPRPPRPGYLVSVRRLSDGLYFGLKQILMLEARGATVPEAWKSSARNLADALVRIFRKHGQIGQYLDIRTAEIGIGGSTAGGVLPAALVLASRLSGDHCYLEAAQDLGRQLVRDSVETGLTTGGPCDMLTAPDSESCFALLVSLVDLFEATGDAFWARAASDLTRQFSTWVTSYDFSYPPDSHLGKVDVPSNGSVWANIQNKHAAPAICNFSGESLFRLWRGTGDELALDLIRDIAGNITHYVSREGHAIGTMGPGMMCERVNISDWEGEEGVGGNIFGSTIWVETALMLTVAELPSLYLRKDTGRVEVFDHVGASFDRRDGKPLLHLHNPTAFDAEVRVLVEEEADLAHPLPLEIHSWCLKVLVKRGEGVELEP
jgi:hypothetical protein